MENKTKESTSKSTRELALEWWDHLLLKERLDKSYHFCTDIGKTTIEFTEKDIEEIWFKEQYIPRPNIIVEPKPNQKQFKEFNPKLFKQYIEKFRPSDRILARIILGDRIKQWEEKGI